MEDLLNELELAEKNARVAYNEYREARSRVEALESDIVRMIANKGDYPFLRLNRTRLNQAVRRGYKC